MSDEEEIKRALLRQRPPHVVLKPERIHIAPPAGDVSKSCPKTATDTDGTVVPCAFHAGHDGQHRFIRIGSVTHWCGICGEPFEVSETDPHWSTGRGPICPKATKP